MFLSSACIPLCVPSISSPLSFRTPLNARPPSCPVSRLARSFWFLPPNASRGFLFATWAHYFQLLISSPDFKSASLVSSTLFFFSFETLPLPSRSPHLFQLFRSDNPCLPSYYVAPLTRLSLFLFFFTLFRFLSCRPWSSAFHSVSIGFLELFPFPQVLSPVAEPSFL